MTNHEHDNCDCLACLGGKVVARLNQAVADQLAAAARLNAINARRVSSEAVAELWINMVDQTARSIGSCAASMKAAMDQFEAAKARCE